LLPIRSKILIDVLIICALLISGLAGLTYGQMPTTQTCESCGMMVASDIQAHLTVKDANGNTHYVDCFKCALKILKNYGQLNVIASCDWNGPYKIITVYLKDNDNITKVFPTSALYIDGNCMKNRIVYDQIAANNLLANNGKSPFTTALQNVTIPSNATIMTIPQAADIYAFTLSLQSTPTPTIVPTETPTTQPSVIPTLTPKQSTMPIETSTPEPRSSPLVAQTCEACGMEVSPEAQQKYAITDASGNLHYAECYMCALNLLKNYDQLKISTYCDWFGPNYPITVQSSNYGKNVTVSPTNAVFLNGGSCVINRAAYNQTAADLLLTNGYSNNTLEMQRFALPSSTQVSTVVQAAITFSENKATQKSQSIPYPLIIACVAGIAIIGASVAAYIKIKSKKP
jgi:hypothetical protein